MFVFLQKDSFARGREQIYKDLNSPTDLLEFEPVDAIRRPYRGIQIKNDTYAVLSVRRPDGSVIPLKSSSAVGNKQEGSSSIGEVKEYADFILQQVQDQRMEKQQIIETFGDTFVYFFGEKPRIVTFSGVLINTEDFNWRAQFWYNYENYLRGSKLAQANARAYLAYDTLVIEGYPLNASAVDAADRPYEIPFTMSMLVTDYHEYSVIGKTRFPGFRKDEGLEVINQGLEKRRSGFVSTTAEVRKANLFDSSEHRSQLPQTNSVLAAMRKGVGYLNDAKSWLNDKMAIGQRLVSGRAIRMPIGAASFLNLAREGEVAAVSVVTSALTAFDAKTGGRFGTIKVNGQVISGTKIQMMGPAKFAPWWTSQVKGLEGSPRGMIYENYDEYPTRSQPNTLEDAGLSTKAFHQREAALMKNMADERIFSQQKKIFNTLAAQGDLLSNIAEVVSTVREGFGMLLTAANVVTNPLGVAGDYLGIRAEDAKMIGEGLSQGSFIPGVSWFLGGAARKKWENWAERVSKPGAFGEAFTAYEYKSSKPKEVSYEEVYGNKDYSSLLQSQRTKDAETTEIEESLPEGVSRSETNADKIERALSETYGDTDKSGGEDQVDPATLDKVYGQGGVIPGTRPNEKQRAEMYYNSYNTPVNDTDTTGIRSADSDDAPIDPVV